MKPKTINVAPPEESKKPVPEAIDDYFKGIGVNKPKGYYGYMDETEIKVYKNKGIENALYLERKRRRMHQGPEFY